MTMVLKSSTISRPITTTIAWLTISFAVSTVIPIPTIISISSTVPSVVSISSAMHVST
uniref:Uncharacterized protein n=1 Tax=Arundo donax TaxID=35708 RepID=A0A0A9AE94_ARUDO